LNGKTVQMHYANTVWSIDESCLVCCCSTEESSPCPLWPSCDTLRPHWEDKMSTLGKLQPVCLQIKPEYLGDWGCEELSPFELAEAWLGSVLRDNADIVRVRIRVDSGEVVWLEYQSLSELLSSNPKLRPEVNAGVLSALLDKLFTTPASDSAKAFLTRDILERFDNTTSALLNLARLCESAEDKDTGETCESIDLSCLTVYRTKLDLNLPAGLEINAPGESGRVMRLPALPVSRLQSSNKDMVSSTPKQAKREPLIPTKRPKTTNLGSPPANSPPPARSKSTPKSPKRKLQRTRNTQSK
uniref:NARG2_C domain-containing protein n=1 Tax=Echinostoma caproni TaxID=27848 RepID=A0A183AXG2_9TREM